MIFLSTNRQEVAGSLLERLEKLGSPVKYTRPGPDIILELYKAEYSALVVDDHYSYLPKTAWMDILEGFGRRIPVIVLSDLKPLMGDSKNHHLFWVIYPTTQSIIDSLQTTGVLGRKAEGNSSNPIASFDESVPLKMLLKNNSLSMLYVDASDMIGLSADHGNIVFQKVQEVFEGKLFSLWGNQGSFRSGDVLFKKSANSCVYYIFLEVARSGSKIPAPGALEKLSDRLSKSLQQALWQDFFQKKEKRVLPESINMIPRFNVGHASVLFNPCLKSDDIINQLLERAYQNALLNHQRIADREREIVQSLVQFDGLLIPNFQAVFWTKTMPINDLQKSIKDRNIHHLKKYIYGFESLIRVSPSIVDSMLEEEGPVYLESSYLRPDVLFYLASKYDLSLELDQACIKLGGRFGAALPGKLLINILPRNLYYVENIEHMIPENVEVIFELSESEEINNFELLLKVRRNLSNMNLGIAADDFGKGYAGLERVIKVKPDLIKLDRMLIQNIDQDGPKMAFVKGLVEAARSSKSMILAEGVETLEEFQALNGLGVDLMQGFLFHRPQALETILNDLSNAKESAEIIPLQKLA